MINIQVHAHWFIIKTKQNKAKQQQKTTHGSHIHPTLIKYKPLWSMEPVFDTLCWLLKLSL